MTPTFFETPAKFRLWLQKHHKTADELWVGFYKKATGKPSITYPEAVLGFLRAPVAQLLETVTTSPIEVVGGLR